jgi:hypothetical protein
LKVLFDEDVPHKLVPFLPGHDIHTVVSMNWGAVQNGALLTLIEQEGFEVFLTGDKNMPNQQQLAGRPAAQPGTVTLIDCGVFVPRSKS